MLVSDGDDSVLPSASPTVGNCQEIIPKALHASLERKSLSVLSVKYMIWRVVSFDPAGDSPVIRSGIAPMMLMLLLLAAVMDILTGYRSDLERLSSLSKTGPERHD